MLLMLCHLVPECGKEYIAEKGVEITRQMPNRENRR